MNNELSLIKQQMSKRTELKTDQDSLVIDFVQVEEKEVEVIISSMQQRNEFGFVARSNALSLMFAQLGLNKTDLIKSTEEIGWWDPELDQKVASTKTLQWLKQLNFQNFIYPNHQMKQDIPKCIFVPEKAFLRKLITAVAKCKSIEDVKQKFGAC